MSITEPNRDRRNDTGFTATGDMRDGVPYHEHLIPYREEEAPAG